MSYGDRAAALSRIRQTGEAGNRTCDPSLQGKRSIHYTTVAPWGWSYQLKSQFRYIMFWMPSVLTCISLLYEAIIFKKGDIANYQMNV